MGELRWQAWQRFARPAQIPNPEKSITFYMGGRGSGKTRAGAEWLCMMACTEPGAYGLVGPDYSHLITECVEPYIYEFIPEEFRRWRGQVNQLDLANGSRIKLYTAEKPGKVRGPNLKGFWFDEPGEMRFGEDAWSNARLAMRIPMSDGSPPRGYVTGTPKRVPLVVQLHASCRDDPEHYEFRAGSMRDNIKNLSKEVVEELEARYEGTRLGRQELLGELLMDVDGALLTMEVLNEHRQARPSSGARMRVMSIDPGFSSRAGADEVGILIGQVVGHGNIALCEVLDDATTRGSPGKWIKYLPKKCAEWGVDVIVYEGNMVGQWLRETLDGAFDDSSVRRPRIESVTSRTSKWARAEPVGALAERGRMVHVGAFGLLESELTGWVPDSGMRSPNRLDAWSQLGRYALIKGASRAGFSGRVKRAIPRVV